MLVVLFTSPEKDGKVLNGIFNDQSAPQAVPRHQSTVTNGREGLHKETGLLQVCPSRSLAITVDHGEELGKSAWMNGLVASLPSQKSRKTRQLW